MGRSNLATWRDLVSDSDSSSSAKLVAHTLTTWMNGAGGCWPSLTEIARRTSLDRKTVVSAIRELERRELLVVSRGRGRASSRYTIDNGGVTPPQQRSVAVESRHHSNPVAVEKAVRSSGKSHRSGGVTPPESAESAERAALTATSALNGHVASAHFDPTEILANAAQFEAEETARREAVEATL